MEKKALSVLFVVTLSVVVVASTAYACTAWVGVFKVAGDHPTSGIRVSTGSYTGCNALTGFPTGGMNQSISGSQAKTRPTSSNPAGWVRVKVEPGTGCNKLPPGPYDINWYSGKGYTVSGGSYTWARDCMSPLMGLGIKVGEIVVDQSGNNVGGNVTDPAWAGWWEFKITSPWANIGSEEGAVCVSDARGGWGNQAPMKVTV